MYLELVFLSLFLCLGLGLFADAVLTGSQRFSHFMSGAAAVVFLLILLATSTLLFGILGANSGVSPSLVLPLTWVGEAWGSYWSR